MNTGRADADPLTTATCGTAVGAWDGLQVALGTLVGDADGDEDGTTVGDADGDEDGTTVGDADGDEDGTTVRAPEGFAVGSGVLMYIWYWLNN